MADSDDEQATISLEFRSEGPEGKTKSMTVPSLLSLARVHEIAYDVLDIPLPLQSQYTLVYGEENEPVPNTDDPVGAAGISKIRLVTKNDGQLPSPHSPAASPLRPVQAPPSPAPAPHPPDALTAGLGPPAPPDLLSTELAAKFAQALKKHGERLRELELEYAFKAEQAKAYLQFQEDLLRKRYASLEAELEAQLAADKARRLARVEAEVVAARVAAFAHLDMAREEAPAVHVDADVGEARRTALAKVDTEMGEARTAALAQLDNEVADKRRKMLAQLDAEMADKRRTAMAQLDTELAEEKPRLLAQLDREVGDARRMAMARLDIDVAEARRTALAELDTDVGDGRVAAFAQLDTEVAEYRTQVENEVAENRTQAEEEAREDRTRPNLTLRGNSAVQLGKRPASTAPRAPSSGLGPGPVKKIRLNVLGSSSRAASAATEAPTEPAGRQRSGIHPSPPPDPPAPQAPAAGEGSGIAVRTGVAKVVRKTTLPASDVPAPAPAAVRTGVAKAPRTLVPSSPSEISAPGEGSTPTVVIKVAGKTTTRASDAHTLPAAGGTARPAGVAQVVRRTAPPADVRTEVAGGARPTGVPTAARKSAPPAPERAAPAEAATGVPPGVVEVHRKTEMRYRQKIWALFKESLERSPLESFADGAMLRALVDKGSLLLMGCVHKYVQAEDRTVDALARKQWRLEGKWLPTFVYAVTRPGWVEPRTWRAFCVLAAYIQVKLKTPSPLFALRATDPATSSAEPSKLLPDMFVRGRRNTEAVGVDRPSLRKELRRVLGKDGDMVWDAAKGLLRATEHRD